MYAVVQIGSRILRSACGTKRSVPPFFCACTEGAAAAVAASAAVPARNVRRLSVMGWSSLSATGAGDGGTASCGVQAIHGALLAPALLAGAGQEGRAMQIVAGTF